MLVNHLAFADDVALVSQTPEGMKRLLFELEHQLGLVGLTPNAAKSSSLRIDVLGRKRMWVCNPDPYLTLDGNTVPAIDIAGAYKYLGIPTGLGRKVGSVATCKLDYQIGQLSKAPLKPEQRIYFLRVHVIPGLYHELVLGRYTMGLLVSLDRKVRAAVRRWVHVPHDLPMGFFHAHSADGGLGLPQLTVQVPLMRRDRVERLYGRNTGANGRDPVMTAVIEQSRILQSERAMFSDGIKCYGEKVTTKNGRRQATAAALHASCDGKGLTDMGQVPAVSRWVNNGSKMVGGRACVNAMQVRAGCLYTKVRASRGRAVKDQSDLACDVCPAKRETLGHILQQCPRPAHARNERHDRIVKFLAQRLSAKGFTAESEPTIKTVDGIRRPDVVAYRPGVEAWVIDVTIVNHLPGEINAAHALKAAKYKRREIRAWVSGSAKIEATNVQFTSLTLNWRGAMSSHSAEDMRKLRLTLSDLEVVSAMVLAGGYKAWQQHRDSTWVRLDFLSNHGREEQQSDETVNGRLVPRGRPPFPPTGAGRTAEAPRAWATAKAGLRSAWKHEPLAPVMRKRSK